MSNTNFSLIIFLLVYTTNFYSQKDKILIFNSVKDTVVNVEILNNQTKIIGKVTDSLGVVKDAHVLNVNTNIGTSSNDDGEFEMMVSLGDIIEVSSVQHKKLKLIIANTILKNKYLAISLSFETYILDEIIVKKHNLSGSLSIDAQMVPRDTIKELVKKMVDDIKNIDFSKPFIKRYDHIDKHVKPPLVIVDPIDKVQGIFFGTSINLGKGKNEISRISFKKKLENKAKFATTILKELGEDFFFNKLKIPEKYYHNFIDFCTYKGVEELYKKGNILELIRIFNEESIAYHKIYNLK